MVRVPNVTGQVPSTGAQNIKSGDLNSAIIVSSVSSPAPAGTVAYTRPAAGTSVPRGTQIKIYISKGGNAVVPDVSGLTVAAAKAKLLAAGFSAVSEPQASQAQFFVKSPTIAKGLVVGTDPAAGTSATGNGAILLIISAGP
jgi:serine/threonine-protein kinase